MNRKQTLEEIVSSRKALFSALVAQSAGAENARREIEARRKQCDIDSERLEKAIRDNPERLLNLMREISALEATMGDPEDARILALFSDN